MATGSAPKEQIDHKNRNGNLNAASNLRDATNGQNQLNKAAWKKNATGAKGVYRHGEKYRVMLRRLGGKRVHVGVFSSFEDAKTAYAEAVKIHHGEWALGAGG